jgi:hypothetical protein
MPAGYGGTTVADWSQLPDATGQTAAPITALRAAAAGTHATDSISGIPVVKLTDTSSPSSGDHAPGYANGGPHMSQAWESGGHTYYTLCLEGSGWLIDIRYDLIGVSDPRVNMRQLTNSYSPGEVNYAWSMDPATPRILFILNGTTVVRYDTDTMANAPSGIFPKTVPGGTWFQTQLNDAWMAGMSDGTNYWALNTATGTVIQCSEARSGLVHDELHLDMTLPVVYLSISGGSFKDNQPWQLDTDTIVTPYSSADPVGSGVNIPEPPGTSDDHATPMRGGMAGTYSGGTPWGGAYVYERDSNVSTAVILGVANLSDTGEFYHNGAGNLFGHGTTFDDQWVLHEKDSGGGSAPIRNGVIGAWKADGSALKYVTAHDSPGTNYGSLPQSQQSPDGKLIFWTSCLGTFGSGNGIQVLMAKMPTI